jgi:hypothetical protein
MSEKTTSVADATLTDALYTAEELEAAAPTAEPATPEQSAAAEAVIGAVEKLKRCHDLAENAVAMKRAYYIAKEVLADRKKAAEAAAFDVIEALMEDDEDDTPLLDGVATDATAGTRTQSEPDDSWRDVDLETLDLTNGILLALASQNITTMGTLADYTKPAANGWTADLADIKGIGPIAIEKINAATDKFWEREKRDVGERTERTG